MRHGHSGIILSLPSGGGSLSAWGKEAQASFVGSGSPVGVVTPSAEGDLYVDNTTPNVWQATGLLNTSWQLVAGAGFIPQGGPLTEDLAGGGFGITGLGDVALTGLTGATAAARFVGGTASGAPVSGTFAVGDFVVDQTGKLWICTIAGSPGTWVNPSAGITSAGLGVYGDGSDGTVTFDGTTTVLGIVPSGGVYTLARDIFLAVATLNSGVQIKTNGFRIYCAGTFTGIDATSVVQWDGGAAALNVAGNGATNGSGSVSSSTTGAAGAAGGTGVGGNGNNNANLCLGGNGGNGGTSATPNAGGTGGTVTLGAANRGTARALPQASLGLVIAAGISPAAYGGGAGGAAGGGDGTHNGGGGGGGGGVVCVNVKTFAGLGAIHARGGAGGTMNAGNVGGGGGGGGGGAMVVSESVASGAISGWTVDANGGAKGSPFGTGTNNATAGVNGTVVLLPN